MSLTPEQLRRWSRQIRLPQLGAEGQEKLRAAKVAIVGVGGLGCPAALYLAAAGIGTLGLIDDDVVDLSNLQRQILYGEPDRGQGKVEVAAERLTPLRSDLTINLHPQRLDAGNAMDILRGYDIVIDGNDNFPTRYAVNDACVLLGLPNVYGSVLQFEGRLSLFVPRQGPCYRCLHAEPPPPGTVQNCAEAGVLGVLPGVVGSLQAAEAIKWICGIGETMVGRLLVIDMLAMRFDEFTITRDRDCALCGNHPTITAPVAYAETCVYHGEEDLGEAEIDDETRITPRAAKLRLDRGENLFILDVREPIEYQMSHLPGATLIPMGTLPSRVGEIAARRDEEVIVLCHHGIRSQMVSGWLRKHGFKKVKNLEGGIDRWAAEADPSIPRY
jgi:adenylyltransferase/sulfurtransferase